MFATAVPPAAQIGALVLPSRSDASGSRSIGAGICLVHRTRPRAATSKMRDRSSRSFNYTVRPAGTLESGFAPSFASEENSMRGIASSRSFV